MKFIVKNQPFHHRPALLAFTVGTGGKVATNVNFGKLDPIDVRLHEDPSEPSHFKGSTKILEGLNAQAPFSLIPSDILPCHQRLLVFTHLVLPPKKIMVDALQ